MRRLGRFGWTLLVVLSAPALVAAGWPPGDDAQAVVAAKGKAVKPKKKPPKAPPEQPPVEPVPTGDNTTAAPTPTLPPPPSLPKKPIAVAVLPVLGLDVGQELLRGIEKALVNEVDETKGMRAVSSADLESDDGRVGLSVAACNSEPACLARCALYARAHRALEARVAALGGTLSISMRLIDSQSGEVVGRVADPLSDDAAERAQELHRLAVQLLVPHTYIGALTISASVEGADVYLDDRLVGTTPLKGALEKLAAGPHILRLTKPGFADLNQFVDVVYKRNSTITVDMSTNTIAGTIVEVESKTGFGSVWVVTDQEGVEIRVDGEPRGTTPLAAAIDKVAAGQRRLSFRREGLPPQVQEVEVKANERVEVALAIRSTEIQVAGSRTVEAAAPLARLEEFVAVASQPVASTTPPALRAWRFPAGLAAAGLGAASIVASGYFGSRVEKANKESAELERDGASNTITKEEYNSIERKLSAVNDRGQRAMVVHFTTLGVGIGLVAVGAGLVIWDLVTKAPGPSPAIEPSTTVGFSVAPLEGGGAAVLNGRF